jgi:hypothetical protein
MKNFYNERLYEILQWLMESKDELIEFKILNPDLCVECYVGKTLTCKGREYRYFSYRALNDLAEILHVKMLTPVISDECRVIIRFKRLNHAASFHTDNIDKKQEKYGASSTFFEINKNEEPSFLSAYKRALESVKIQHCKQILNLGINRGDEFELIRVLLGDKSFKSKRFIGIDHSASAIEIAKERFDGLHVSLHVKDINDIDELNLTRSDLLISIGTLQSPSINFKPFFMKLIQEYLSERGSVILGFPNCRWIDTEMIYGAKAPNYSYSEQSLLYNDVMFCKKYLQQHKFRVTLTGKQYLFLTATKIG